MAKKQVSLNEFLAALNAVLGARVPSHGPVSAADDLEKIVLSPAEYVALLERAGVDEAERAKVVMSYRPDNNTFVKRGGPLEGTDWDADKDLYGSDAIIRIGLHEEIDKAAKTHMGWFNKKLEYTHPTTGDPGNWVLKSDNTGKRVAEGDPTNTQIKVAPKDAAVSAVPGTTQAGPATPIAPKLDTSEPLVPDPPKDGPPKEEPPKEEPPKEEEPPKLPSIRTLFNGKASDDINYFLNSNLVLSAEGIADAATQASNAASVGSGNNLTQSDYVAQTVEHLAMQDVTAVAVMSRDQARDELKKIYEGLAGHTVEDTPGIDDIFTDVARNLHAKTEAEKVAKFGAADTYMNALLQRAM
jgi:hypothetical protein